VKSQIVTTSSVPRYRQLVDIMVTEIRDKNLAPGNRFLSEHLWAARFKVSRPTVRQALQCLEQEGILKRERGRGTFVATPPILTGAEPRSPSNDIGVLVPCVAVYALMVRAVEDVCKEHDCHLIIGNTDQIPEKEKRYLAEWVARPMAGLIAFPSYNSRLQDYLVLRDRDLPSVLLDTNIEGLNADLVCAENVNGALEGTRILIRNGCRRIAFVSGYFSASTSRARLEGWRAAMEEAGLTVDRDLILDGGFTPEFGRAAVNELLSRRQDVDGIFIANHPVAKGVVPALLERGVRIPEDIKLCTFDQPDLPIEAQVPLVMVKQPYHAEGRAAAELLMQRIAERRSGVKRPQLRVIEFPVTVVDRISRRAETMSGAERKRVLVEA